MQHAIIQVRTQEPDYSNIPNVQYDWQHSVYGKVHKILPRNAPPPRGKFVTLTHYVDANLYHDMLAGRSVTGILHLLNQTPVAWWSKKQNAMETATYESEFVAARVCTEQIIGLRI